MISFVRAVALASSLVLAGCSLPPLPGSSTSDGSSPSPAVEATASASTSTTATPEEKTSEITTPRPATRQKELSAETPTSDTVVNSLWGITMPKVTGYEVPASIGHRYTWRASRITAIDKPYEYGGDWTMPSYMKKELATSADPCIFLSSAQIAEEANIYLPLEFTVYDGERRVPYKPLCAFSRSPAGTIVSLVGIGSAHEAPASVVAMVLIVRPDDIVMFSATADSAHPTLTASWQKAIEKIGRDAGMAYDKLVAAGTPPEGMDFPGGREPGVPYTIPREEYMEIEKNNFIALTKHLNPVTLAAVSEPTEEMQQILRSTIDFANSLQL